MPTAALQTRRRKGSKHAKGGVCVQQQMKLNGHLYVHKAMSLELQAAANLEALQSVQAELLASRRREQLLIDMVLHQDVVVAEIEQQQQHHHHQQAAATVAAASQQQQCTAASAFNPFGLPDAVGQAAAAAHTAGTRRAAASCDSQAAEGSYVTRLLRNATVEQVQLVEAWGVEDWCNYWRSLFSRLALLLELATCEAADAAEPQQAAAPLFDGSSRQDMHTAGSAAAAATASTAAAAAAAAGAGLYMQQLEQVVDEAQTMIYLANCHNHLPMFQSVTVNLKTGATGATATAGHRLRVARRMELTPWQVQQLAAAMAEFERLSHDHSREGSALMSRANSPGWLFAEAAEQAGKKLQRDYSSTTATAEPAAAISSPEDASMSRSSSSSSGSGSDAGAGGSSLDRQLGRHVKLRHLHMVSLHMVMANTLSRLQIAKFLVALYPLGPVATAITEAVALAAANAAPDGLFTGNLVDAAGGFASCSRDESPPLMQYQQQHEAARAALLSRQQQRWWQEVGECSQALGRSQGRAWQQLLLQQ